AGKMIFGRLWGQYVACMSGRFHWYEGYDFEDLAAPIRVLKLLGVRATILTNAAGAVNTAYKVGDIMVVKDHIKLMGASPMRGPNIPELGPRFFDVSEMYTPALRALALACAESIGQGDRMREGTYFYFGGPQFETPAEIRAARILGGDAVGMSTVTEALTAAHCGMEILALSLMTNMAAGVLPQRLSAEEVSIAAAEAGGRFRQLVRAIVEAM
ncbi:MAG: purine-nucleoside phosphorylase, partial [Rectinemataceae bacterium]